MTERVYHVVNQGLKIEADLSYDQWESVGRSLGRGLDNWHWVIGDWLVYGNLKFGETVWASKLQPGQSKYDKPSMITGLSIDVLELCFRVALAYPQGDRIEGASWSRHKDAMRASDRFELLRKSVAQQWSIQEWHEAMGWGAGNSHLGAKRDIRCPHCGEVIPAGDLGKYRT